MKNKGIKIQYIDGRKTVEGLGYYDIEAVSNTKELVKNSVLKYGDKAAFKYKGSNNEILEKSTVQFAKEVDSLGTALVSMGLKGKRIAIIGENRYEWALAFFSIANGTGIAVPLDKHLPEIEIENLIKRGGVEAIIYSPDFTEEMIALAKKDSSIQHFICMESNNVGSDNRFAAIPELIHKGNELLNQGNKSFIDAVIDNDAMALILFTSGTTSMSKAVMLSQKNLCFDASAVATVIKVYSDDVHLSVLPLHHTFELTAGMLFMLKHGVCIAYSEGIKHIAKNLKEFDVTILVVVPAILEAMYKKLKEGIKKSGKENILNVVGFISDNLRKVGIDIRKKAFRSVLEKIAPRLRLAVSGAAPLDKEVIVGFDRIGFRILQGYGLTETAPVVAVNNDFHNKPGTIGHPITGVQVAIDNPDENGMGEIITRGKNVMLGYFEDDAATSESIKEGWFYTGDLGYIDDEGFITITGRAKSMIVLTNGKKAFPEEYEMLINDIECVKESFVWGNTAPDGDIQICAKIVLNKEAITEKFGKMPDQVVLAEYLQQAIKRINQDIPQYKIIRYFVISFNDLVKTTTLKIKRPIEQQAITDIMNCNNTNMRKASGKIIDDMK